MKSILHIVVLSTFLLGIGHCFGQQIQLEVVFNDTTLKANKLVNYQQNQTLSNLQQEINDILNGLHQQAFITATLDSITADSTNFKAHIALGKVYRWSYLNNRNIDEEVLSKIGYRDKFFNNRPFNPDQLKKFFTRVVTHYENHGHPFASVQLDSIEIANNRLNAVLSIQKNQLYKIDSVIIKGDRTISDQYIKNYVRIKEGDLYNESDVARLSTKINELPFVAEEQKWRIQFNNEESKLYLFLKKKQASRFNGVLGVLPDDETGKLRLTGDVKLNLMNAFRNGERITFNWRAIQENTQDLQFDVAYPFLMNSPFGLDYNFKLYKRDTTFIDVGHKIGLRYILKGNNYFKVFFHNKSSNLLARSNFSSLTVLPSYADVSTQLYGIGFYLENLDYTLNPKKGYMVDFDGSLGNKRIKQNPEINPELYENINLKTNIYNAEIDMAYYFPLSKRSVIKLGSKSGYTYNENLFENELFRIGGLLTLRGFDEESIFASLYTIETLEYRFILEQNSYFFAFFDGAFYEKENINESIVDRPFGFGAGMSFETRAGIFSISYALGKQFDNPILFRSGKVHFGFVNFF